MAISSSILGVLGSGRGSWACDRDSFLFDLGGVILHEIGTQMNMHVFTQYHYLLFDSFILGNEILYFFICFSNSSFSFFSLVCLFS